MPYCPFRHPVPEGAAACPECGVEIEGGTWMPESKAQSDEPTDTSTDRIASLASGLRGGARLLENVVLAGTFLGALAGVILMVQTEEYGDDRPYLALGAVVVLSSILTGLFYWCIARSLRLYAEHTAMSCSVDLDER